MNTTALIGILVVIIVAAAGAAVMMHGGGGETSTTTAATTTAGGGETTSQGGTGSLDISGTWEGTFTTHRMGTGHFKWIIKKKTDGEYTGILITRDAYPLNCYIPITVTVNGDQIKLGTVGSVMPGVGAVVFTGTISGNGGHAEGTWQFVNQVDSGSWSGDRTSSSTQYPTDTCISGGESTTETTTSSTGSGGGMATTSTAACTPTPLQGFEDVFNNVYSVITGVVGEENMVCTHQISGQSSSGTMAYTAIFDLNGQDSSNAAQLYQALLDAFESNGVDVVQSYMGDNSIVYALNVTSAYNGAPTAFTIAIEISYLQGETSMMIVITSETLSETGTPTTTSTQSGGGGSVAGCSGVPSEYTDFYSQVVQAIASALSLGGVNAECTSQVTQGSIYISYYSLQGYQPSQANMIYQSLLQSMQNQGLTVLDSYVTDTTIVISVSSPDEGLLSTIGIDWSDETAPIMVIQVQPYGG